MKTHFKLSHPALALMLALGTAGQVQADSTSTTASVQGTPPELSAPSNGTLQAVDFGGTFATAGQLSTNDTLVMKYTYQDAEGDVDNSHTTVIWSYTPAGGGADQPISATSVPATVSGGEGTSTIIIPAAALGAAAIKVTLQAQSATGDPLSVQTQAINVTDTSLYTTPGGGGGGGRVTPPGPVLPGTNIAGGIFLQSDNPSAGSSATDYSRTPSSKPQVGQTYVFRAWNDTNGNGVWDAGETDVTATLGSIQWQLNGTNTTASGSSMPTTLSNHAIPGATTDSYTVPVNSASSSGATPGDQGFSLQVSFN